MKNEQNTNNTVADNRAETKDDMTIADYVKDFNSDLDIHDNYITDFDAHEAMLISKTYDSVSRQTKNGITDSDAATMAIERSARVVGQLPEGEVTAAGKKDKGKAQLMNIIVQKHIYRNANAQRPLLEKFRMLDLYSSVYGVMVMYVDWDVTDKYIGPNCWLWSPRNFVPQQGRFSIADMDYCNAVTYFSKKDIEDLIENWSVDSGWDKQELEILLEKAENSFQEPDTQRNSYVERQRSKRAVKDKVMVVTRYEAGDEGKWVTFTPDYSGIQLRKVDNPHKNSKIPFVVKPCIPLLDSFYGLADFARAKPLQFAKDGLTNFYFQGIKMNIYPPTVVNANGILKHTVSNEPGSIWEEIIPNSARRLETSTAGLATYQAAMSQMSGGLQNVYGTTTTQLNAKDAMSPQLGKTPEAIKYQSGRESARDNQNRTYLQAAIQEIIDIMLELIVNMGTESIPIDLYSEDIMEIQKAGYTDVMEMLVVNESGTSARLMIDSKKLKDVIYRFEMTPDSTIKADKEAQRSNLLEFMGVLGKNANVLMELQKTTGKVPNWEKIIESYTTLADIPGIDAVFIDSQPVPEQQPAPKQPYETINYKDAPEDIKRQIEQQAGLQPSHSISPAGTQQAMQHSQMADATMSAEQAQTAQPQAPQSPIAPQSINAMLFNDPAIHAVAKDMHSMRTSNAK